MAAGGTEAKRRKGRGKARTAAVSTACATAGSKSCTVAQAKPGANLSASNYAGADLAGKALNAASLSNASLANAKLAGASFAGANLANACLAGADLSGANLKGTSLSGADLTGANLSGANLRGSKRLRRAAGDGDRQLRDDAAGREAGELPDGDDLPAGACVSSPQGTCPTGANRCGPSGSDICNGTSRCRCYSSAEGETRCGDNVGGGACGGCHTTAECEAAYPDVPGVFCAVGSQCCGGTSGYCNFPCPTPA